MEKNSRVEVDKTPDEEGKPCRAVKNGEGVSSKSADVASERDVCKSASLSDFGDV